ncbi:hypothetical protein MtrunA17_Chr6g0468441 [Medicago truncatula]|uniref:Uncharacterized protein n=1 Tax=Medicago truncatula TaxID=3880 RepID=A0A396HFP9_MEDTR|nr:hypothetical protein MtrunA17_Chr6g0468441 [Medicago truncatula]
MASSSSNQTIKINTNKSYVLKERTVTVPLERLDVQIESPVDFDSLKRNGVDIQGFFKTQNMLEFFKMLNLPSYMNLVKDFWVRAEVFDRRSAEEEEEELIKKNPELKGKSRLEMGLRPFRGVEIRSSMMGMEIIITEETITKACRCENDGLFQKDAVKTQWTDKINAVLYNGNPKGKKADLSTVHRMLLKIMNDCIFQKGGGTDYSSFDHKLVLCCLATCKKVNIPKYILHHMCWALKESQNNLRRQIPFGRVLSEIFVKGKLLEHLRNSEVSSDDELGTVVGKIINGKTLQSMNIIKAFKSDEKDLKPEFVESELMRDFSPISREDNSEVLYQFIKAHFEDSGKIISIASIPEKMGGAPLKVKEKRSRIIKSADAAPPKSKRSKS